MTCNQNKITMIENYNELISTIADFLNGTVEIKDNQIIITLKEDNNKEKIDNLSDETFTSVCEELGNDKVKELSDSNDYKEFIEYTKEWINNKIDTLNKELEMLNN